LTVNFTDLSTGEIETWDWDFGDGSPHSGAQNPAHEYTDVGFYTVTLTVTGPCGSDAEVKTDYIEVTEPGGGFCDDFNDGDASDWTVVAGTWSVVDFQYDGINTSGKGYSLAPTADMADGTITVDWTSLTGGSWTNGMVLFAWQDVNNYRVIDMRDGSNNWFIREFIGGTRYNRASVSETINTNQQYDIQVVVDPSGLVTLFVDGVEKVSYDFGDVITGAVGLAVENSHSQFDDFCVSAEAPPVAEFSGDPTSGCAPLTVSFTDLSTGQIDTWDWDFGDGQPHSGEQNPTHEYAEPGDYTVSLTVTGPGGSDTETKTDYIHVEGPPVAAFVGSPTSGSAPLTVSFTDQSTGQITDWNWNFGDGSPGSGEQNPVHEYTSEGTYTVSLTVGGPCGKDTETKIDYITVTGAPTLIGEVGSFSHDQTDASTWYTVNLNNSYASPVVIAKALSFNGGQPSHLRVRNVTASSFEWQIEEWEYLDGYHVAETISYMVVEAGRHTLEDGTILEAGTESVNQNWATVSFSQSFGSTPTLLTSVVTDADPIAVVTRTRNLGSGSFQVKVQEEEAQDGSHAYETIGWLAIEQGTGTNNGRNFHAGRTSNSVTHDWYAVSLTGFSSAPIFLCHDDTYDGGNTCSTRWRNLGASSVEVMIEEEQSADSEVNHTTEVVGYLAWAGAGEIMPAGRASFASLPEIPEETIGRAADAMLPGEFNVSLISPNPFRTQAQFALALPKDAHVSAVVFNVAGKKVKTLRNGVVGAGTHIIRWDGRDESGRQVAAGIYFCRVIADKEKVTRKMIFAG
jgi:PKD repeat protein